jgi:hypothetical protein
LIYSQRDATLHSLFISGKLENILYLPEKGISMGSPVSNTIAEIFLQYIGDTYLKQLLDTKNIILYTRYVDDILLI